MRSGAGIRSGSKLPDRLRGVGIDELWQQFAAVDGLGLLPFVGSLVLFRRSFAAAQR